MNCRRTGRSEWNANGISTFDDFERFSLTSNVLCTNKCLDLSVAMRMSTRKETFVRLSNRSSRATHDSLICLTKKSSRTRRKSLFRRRHEREFRRSADRHHHWFIREATCAWIREGPTRTCVYFLLSRKYFWTLSPGKQKKAPLAFVSSFAESSSSYRLYSLSLLKCTSVCIYTDTFSLSTFVCVWRREGSFFPLDIRKQCDEFSQETVTHERLISR